MKLFSRATMLFLLCMALFASAATVQAASDLADGTYSIAYTVLKAEDDSVSMANDYWEKPATMYAEKGKLTVQLQINHSQWVKEFKVEAGGSYTEAKQVSKNDSADTRVVKFQVDDFSKPVMAKIHVIVESIDYNHKYTIRMAFDNDSLTLIKAADKQAVNKPADNESKPTPKPTAKPTAKPAETTGTATPTAPAVKPADHAAKPDSAAKPDNNGGASEAKTGEASPATSASVNAGKADNEGQSTPEATPVPSDEPVAPAAETKEPESNQANEPPASPSPSAESTDVQGQQAAADGEDTAGVVQTVAEPSKPAGDPAKGQEENGRSNLFVIAILAVILLGGGLVLFLRSKKGSLKK
ncbi:heme uptake protein IsdC [Paenibacillus sp. NPDC058174]|uniref:heme uptake protein IsdC n=1 Tax=Paenibacillus sp. NPDC058174 TaxID=3346366 RepID=UPI0036DAB1AC